MKERQLYLFGFNRDKEKINNQYKIIIPLDGLILLSIAVIVLLIFSFSLGVNKGKKTAQNKAPAPEPTNSRQALEAVEKPVEKIKSEAKKTKIEKKYHIQVASFKKKSSANIEAVKLRKEGYPVTTNKRGAYTVVWIGGFATKKEAESLLKPLRKKYKDCIIR